MVPLPYSPLTTSAPSAPAAIWPGTALPRLAARMESSGCRLPVAATSTAMPTVTAAMATTVQTVDRTL
jgi:hypothetical protein